jgi:hypothetical protein
MNYYQIDNPGIKNWITYEDNEIAKITQYPPNIWVTENIEWAQRVGATELSKDNAQMIVDVYITQLRIEWQNCMNTYHDEQICGPEPPYFILP